jgi:predicted ribosome quality control (RQC) complex YloA/Tae2 family protein
MSLKWKEISLLIEEARPALVGSTLQKVAQLRELANGETFLFQGFGSAGPWRLWVCLLQDHSCWVLANDEWETESQPEPSNFVMVMRKRLMGRRIVALEQVRAERILLMHFDEGVSLLFELMPKRANVVLVENWDKEERTGRALQSFRQISLETGGIYRVQEAPATLSAAAQESRPFELEEGNPFPYHRAVGRKYWDSVQKTGFSAYQRLWRQTWKSHSRKVKTALENVTADLEEAREAEAFQKKGMALVTHLYELGAKSLPKQKKIELDGLEITLDPSKSYSDNAEHFFKKAKKFHRAVGELEGRMQELETKASHMEKVAKAIDSAKSDEELEKLTKELQREKLEIPERPSGVEEKEEAGPRPYLEVESTDGFTILCGRNQEENRRVTFRESKGNDIWMHAKGLPGAHVVIKEQRNKSVPLSTLLEAAQLCLYHSKIRKGKRAEVDYTPRKHVRAIKGTLAEVTYTGNKTIYVEADPDEVKKLMRS